MFNCPHHDSHFIAGTEGLPPSRIGTVPSTASYASNSGFGSSWGFGTVVASGRSPVWPTGRSTSLDGVTVPRTDKVSLRHAGAMPPKRRGGRLMEQGGAKLQRVERNCRGVIETAGRRSKL